MEINKCPLQRTQMSEDLQNELSSCKGLVPHLVLYLDSVSRAVEKADAADTVKDGIAAVLQHVVGADWRLTLPLGRKDGPLHYGEVLLVQHLRDIRQLTTEKQPPKKKKRLESNCSINLLFGATNKPESTL